MSQLKSETVELNQDYDSNIKKEKMYKDRHDELKKQVED